MNAWAKVLSQTPLIAILRGVRPAEAVDIAQALLDGGFLCVEVPLNSPEPFRSIALIRERFDGRLVSGAGTVLSPGDVAQAHAAGAQIIVSPNADRAVIAATKAAGMISLPAFFTPTEAFAALAAGADALKLFPAEASQPRTLKAIRAVLPPSTPVFPVGGVDPGSIKAWRDAGAGGFGVGSALYRPGATPSQVRTQAEAFVAAYRASDGASAPIDPSLA